MGCAQVWEAFQSHDVSVVAESEIHEDCSRQVQCVRAGDGDVCATVMQRYACATESCQVGPRFGSSSSAPVRGWASVAVIQDVQYVVRWRVPDLRGVLRRLWFSHKPGELGRRAISKEQQQIGAGEEQGMRQVDEIPIARKQEHKSELAEVPWMAAALGSARHEC